MDKKANLFQEDLDRDLEDPVFRAACLGITARIATIDRIINALDDARRAQGLSKATLARAVGMNPSSIRRLFSAQGNPTLATLSDIAAVLGMTVTVAPASTTRASESYDEFYGHQPAPVGEAAAALYEGRWLDLRWLAAQSDASGTLSPQALATFMDYLPTAPGDRQALLATAPPPTGSQKTDNLLAGVAETIADETGFPVPDWCAGVAPLAEPVPVEGTPRMIARQRGTALPRLLARGVTMPRASLFRDRPAMDAR